ncbi:MAG: hypothetical protein GX089_15480 [Fibrobacter sp.]|nr:hypothetical protein [Fibrobacter sp.]
MKKSANFYLILTLIVNIALVGCRILSGNEGSDEDGNKDNEMNCTRIGGHTYYQNIFIHGGCVHVQENKKEI